MPGNFLDTNILIYLAAGEPEKAARSRELVDQGGWISVQVLNEVVNVTRRKLQLAWPDVHELLELVRAFLEVAPLTVETHELSLMLARRYRLAVYDSVIVAAALLTDCSTLWSEDMQDGMVIEGALTIRNPFVSA